MLKWYLHGWNAAWFLPVWIDLFNMFMDKGETMKFYVFAVRIVLSGLFLTSPVWGKVIAHETFKLQKANLPQDILIADFEGSDYGDWTVSGQAFGTGPAQGTLANQREVLGYEGNGLVNTFYNGDGTVGTLTSPIFKVERPYISFLLGGGMYPDLTCMNLLADGRVVRTAVGAFNGSEQLQWQSWDVRDLMGRNVQIQIVDQHTGGWGHIHVDHITQSNTKRQVMAVKDRVFQFQQPYLNFPVKNGAPKHLVRLYINDTLVREFNIELASDKPDFWVFMDVSEFQGQEGTLRFYQYQTDCNLGFDAVFQADTFPGQETLYQETLRPQIHFSSRRGWLNDTNGMVWYEGEYHMFYQHTPFSWIGNDKYWGHAVSTDMVHWEELPDAIYPDELGSIWSGSAVIDHHNTAGFQTGSEKTMVCFYTTAGGVTPWSQGQPFTQSMAYSNDRGRTWTKYADNPVIGPIAGGTRDPKVLWHEPTGTWVMVLWIDGSTLSVFTSSDLKTWQKQSDIEGFFECPELFELPVDGDPSNKKWVVYGANGDYKIGTFNGKHFIPESGMVKFEYGNCFYASQTFNNIPDADGRRIQMTWGRVTMPEMPFNQMILFPVTLTLHTTEDGIRMFVNPVAEIALLHRQHWNWNDLIVKPNENPLSEITGELFHIQAEINPQNAQRCGVVIRDVPVVYDAVGERLICQGKTAPLKPKNGTISLEILVDRMSIEIYANGGQVYMPIGVNLTDNPDSLEFVSEKGDTLIEMLDIYNLDSIWR